MGCMKNTEIMENDTKLHKIVWNYKVNKCAYKRRMLYQNYLGTTGYEKGLHDITWNAMD